MLQSLLPTLMELNRIAYIIMGGMQKVDLNPALPTSDLTKVERNSIDLSVELRQA